MAPSRKNKRSQQQQKGGAFSFDGPAWVPQGGAAPEAARTSVVDGAELVRSAPSVPQTGAWAQSGGGCGCMATPPMLPPQQRGGGSGTGGFGFTLSNEFGKVYADVPRGSCVLPQRGGASSDSYGSIVSFPAGYGYDSRSVNEINNGTAHFLAQLPYGRHMMGGKKRQTRRQKSQKKSQKKSRKSQKSRKSRKSQKKSHKHQ